MSLLQRIKDKVQDLEVPYLVWAFDEETDRGIIVTHRLDLVDIVTLIAELVRDWGINPIALCKALTEKEDEKRGG